MKTLKKFESLSLTLNEMNKIKGGHEQPAAAQRRNEQSAASQPHAPATPLPAPVSDTVAQ